MSTCSIRSQKFATVNGKTATSSSRSYFFLFSFLYLFISTEAKTTIHVTIHNAC